MSVLGSRSMIYPSAKDSMCDYCGKRASYVLVPQTANQVALCILHFSLIRNEMQHLVLHEHAFVTRENHDNR